MESHLLQMRGLKPLRPEKGRLQRIVASFTDAWIETGKLFYMPIDSWGRIFYRCVD